MEDQAQKGKQTSWGIIAVIIVIVIAALVWLYVSSTECRRFEPNLIHSD